MAVVFAAFRLSKKTDPDYFTAKVEKGDIRQVIEATGTINPVTSVQVGSQVSGMISKLYVDFNSKVTKGQVIAEIDPKLFQGAVLQAQADLQNSQALLAAAKANLAKDQATQQQNKLDYDRAVSLQRARSHQPTATGSGESYLRCHHRAGRIGSRCDSTGRSTSCPEDSEL